MAKRLQEFAERQKEGLPLRLDNIEGQTVTVQDVHWGKGNFGEYAVMSVIDENGEVMAVMTSAMLVMDALAHCEEEGGFPIEAVFTRKGRVWLVE